MVDHIAKPRVLIVDDEPSICDVLVSVLSNLGYEAIALQDPRAALRFMETAQPIPDLLITDFAMPYMSGLELIQRGKSLHPELKTILASGEVDAPGSIGISQPDAYLEKPFGTKALSLLVRSILEPRANAPSESP